MLTIDFYRAKTILESEINAYQVALMLRAKIAVLLKNAEGKTLGRVKSEITGLHANLDIRGVYAVLKLDGHEFNFTIAQENYANPNLAPRITNEVIERLSDNTGLRHTLNRKQLQRSNLVVIVEKYNELVSEISEYNALPYVGDVFTIDLHQNYRHGIFRDSDD